MESGAEKLSWGIITAGKIARKFTRGVLNSRTGRVAAVGSSSLERAQRFAREFGIP